MRVEVKPKMLRWARERSGQTTAYLVGRFPKIELWEKGEINPTLKQLENFAKAAHLPIGYLFLSEPPVEKMPIPDCRTVNNVHIGHPSPDLLETIYICQQRQEWYRNYARSMGEDPLSFIGSADLASDIIETATEIRHILNFDIEKRRQMPTWTEALRRFIEQADDFGVMVMVSGVVGNNNRRKLDPEEFRGLALADEFAPLVFINGADTKAAQMFTLAHELAHLWLGESALSDTGPVSAPSHDVEKWCNQVAAELLVPLSIIKEEYQPSSDLNDEVNRLARRFKVSTLVILRRIHDGGGLTREEFWEAFNLELERLCALPGGSGGNFYLTQAARVSKRFARALVISTLEGQTLYRDARNLLGFSKFSTFQELGHSLGVL
jgi:Zn-dependent peptidase ImmA (M78 family)/transcriptional regulator with XRE-family HTH domain